MKILLIDDSKTSRASERLVLTHLGYQDVEEACDGLDALSRMASCKPDLIIVDWDMPNMDGLTFVETVRRKDHKTPIIMVSAEREREHVIEALRAGVNNYVIKPFTSEDLAERITRAMTHAYFKSVSKSLSS